MKGEGKAKDQDKSGAADHQRDRHLRQGAEAQGCEELRSGAVADGENEQAEENCLENRRDDEVTKLADDHRDNQGTGGGADRETKNFKAPEDGADRDRQQQENLRRGGNDPRGFINVGESPRTAAPIRSAT